MGRTFTASAKSAEAPDVEPGVYDLRFEGTAEKTISGGQYQKNPAGDPKLEWSWTIFEDGKPIFEEREEHPSFGEEVGVECLTGIGFNTRSKTVPQEVRILKALLTAEEFAAFEDGEGTEEAELIGRMVQGEVYIKDGGWLGVTNIIPARKVRRKATSSADAE